MLDVSDRSVHEDREPRDEGGGPPRPVTPLKVFWTTNLIAKPGESVADPASGRFGGWIANMLSALGEVPGLSLGAAVRTAARDLAVRKFNGVTTFYVPFARRGGLAMEPGALAEALAQFAPGILHVEGAEMPHASQAIDAFDGPTLLSLQGVMGGYGPHAHGDLPVWPWALGIHKPRRAAMAAALLAAKRLRFDKRAASEAHVMRRVTRVVGRTEWDRAYASTMSPQARYSHVGRILRPQFYGEWPRVRSFKRHQIFIGNANDPRKGAHVALDALALLVREFSDVSLVIAGEPPATGWRAWRKGLGYPRFLADKIAKLGLGSRVRYTGVLGADAICTAMRRSHVFLLPSLIENSPNTLGEAMMLGLPCVCAYAGGSPDMAAPDREALFYRAEDPVAMAHQIARVFRSEMLACSLGSAAACRAQLTHDPRTNRDKLLAVYEELAPATATTRPSLQRDVP
ncbi:MAG: glycosyltransferase family 4 protein [Pseudomonadota bacterium]